MAKTPIGQVLARNLEEVMAKRGINQQRLAERTGFSTSTVSEIRRGITSPGLDTLERFAEVLGVEVWELLVEGEEIRRRVIERYLHPTPEDGFVPDFAGQSKVRDLRGVAARRRKKPQSPKPEAQ